MIKRKKGVGLGLDLTIIQNRMTMAYMRDLYEEFGIDGTLPGVITIDIDGSKANLFLEKELLEMLYHRLAYDTNTIMADAQHAGKEDAIDVCSYKVEKWD